MIVNGQYKRGPEPSLSDEQKREIINSKLSPDKLAVQFAVSKSAIYRAIRNRDKKG